MNPLKIADYLLTDKGNRVLSLLATIGLCSVGALLLIRIMARG